MKKYLFACLLLILPVKVNAMPVQQLTSPGGLSVWYVEDKTTPSLTYSFAFRGGSENDPADKQGVSALMAAALAQGAGKYDSTAFAQSLSDNNISLSFSGGRDQLTGDLRFLLSHTDEAVALTRAALSKPHFAPDDVKRLQAGLLATFSRTANDPDWQATRLMFQLLFAGTPYAQSSRGTPTTLPAITPADLRKAQAASLVKSRLVIVAVGAADAATVGTITDRLFGNLPAGKPIPAARFDLQHEGQTWHHAWPQAPQAVVHFALPGLPPHDVDYPAFMVLNDIVGGGGFRARLMKELRQKLGATYGIGTTPLNLAGAPFIYGQGSVQLDQLEPALATIRSTLQEATSGAVSETDLADSKTYLAGAFARDLTSSAAIADFILAARLANLPADYYDTYPARIQAVTPDDLKRVAAKLMNPAQLRFAIVSPYPPAKVDKTVTDLWATNP